MPLFSEDQVIALAPDESSARSGRELASGSKWVSCGAGQNAIWGECQGSGSSLYQTCVDTGVTAFKCSCASRKFPCKHCLALLLLFCSSESSFKNEFPPEWALAWLNARRQRAPKTDGLKAEPADRSANPAAREKRRWQRLARVEAGLAEFRLWLCDRVRQGLAGLDSQPYQFWDAAAARLTDAQAPGLARQLRQCAGIPNSGEGWQERLLERLSLMHLAAEAFGRAGELPEDLRQDLRAVIGFTVSQDDVLKQDGLRDCWQVLGQRVEVEDRLKVQRTWLRGVCSRQWALVLSFAHGNQPLSLSLPCGYSFEGELAFYPAAFKLRALLKARLESPVALSSFIAYKSVAEFLEEYSSALALNPWLESFPVAVDNVVAGWGPAGQFMIIDCQNAILPVGITDGDRWQIMALTGGHPFSLFGEWNGRTLRLLAVMAGGNYSVMGERVSENVG
jgi:hypothetical protein